MNGGRDKLIEIISLQAGASISMWGILNELPALLSWREAMASSICASGFGQLFQMSSKDPLALH